MKKFKPEEAFAAYKNVIIPVAGELPYTVLTTSVTRDEELRNPELVVIYTEDVAYLTPRHDAIYIGDDGTADIMVRKSGAHDKLTYTKLKFVFSNS